MAAESTAAVTTAEEQPVPTVAGDEGAPPSDHPMIADSAQSVVQSDAVRVIVCVGVALLDS
jgi:hypothetical protein